MKAVANATLSSYKNARYFVKRQASHATSLAIKSHSDSFPHAIKGVRLDEYMRMYSNLKCRYPSSL